MDVGSLRGQFRARYGCEPRIFSAPGRVNLIGEHTDYNEGFVMPVAIDRRTYVAAARRDDRRLRAFSLGLGEGVELELDAPREGHRGWADYVEGVARELGREVSIAGADMLIASEVPLGAGLSSSAALELSVGFALARLNEVALPPLSLARIGQRAEHAYVGTQCGIMDQYVAERGRAGHALLIDCRSLESQAVPIGADVRIVVCNTLVKHSLATSAYNRRRQECDIGCDAARRLFGAISSLRDVTVDHLPELEANLTEPYRRRVRHVVRENDRTVRAAALLRDRDYESAGKLFFESHESLRRDYEVSCEELDVLVEAAAKTSGVYGFRMTGGGFGGCAIGLVRPDAVGAVEESLERAFRDAFDRSPEFFEVEASEGAGES